MIAFSRKNKRKKVMSLTVLRAKRFAKKKEKEKQTIHNL